MKLSDLTGDPAPTRKLSDLIAEPPKPAGPPSALDTMLKPLKAVPGAIADEFSAGKKQFDEGLSSDMAKLKAGKEPGWQAGGTLLGGMMQELFSPITGAAKAIVGDPIRANVPGEIGEAAAKTGEIGASMVGPSAISKSLGMVSKVLPGYTDAVQKLMDAGVKLTPGQIWQGMSKRAEDALRSFPGLGDVIAGGQYRALEDFNRAVLNKALEPLGSTLPKDIEIGPKAIAATEKIIGEKYDALLPKLTFNAADPSLAKDIADITKRTTTRLPKDQQAQFAAVLKDIDDRVTKAATGHTIDGYIYKQVESELSYLGRTYGKSDSPDHRLFADAIGDLQGAMRDALERANPDHAAELRDLNGAWAAFKRAQGASIRRVSSNGVFSPADLLADIKRSSSQGAFARGDGLLQDLASAGQHVLPSTVPDSGTMRRALAAEVVGTGGAAALDHPNIAIGLATGAAPYTKPGMAAVNAMAKGVPSAARSANAALRSPIMGVAAGMTDENAP